MTDTVRLLVFCKAPIAGSVKTRLMSEFSESEAAGLHQELATETLQDCLEVAKRVPEVKLELWCSPDTHHPFFEKFEQKGYALHRQEGVNLGAKMHRGFAKKSIKTLLIGTDCPPIDVAYLLDAIEKLAVSEVVLAPAEDGGYGLIGLQEPNACLFEGVAWSTDQVLAQTLRRCEEQGLKAELLPQIWDVDYPEDVEKWRSESHEKLIKLNQYQ